MFFSVAAAEQELGGEGGGRIFLGLRYLV